MGIVAGYDNTESYKPKKDRVCDINVDLYKRREPQVKGDPHFVGFRGQKYDFHGEVDGVFNIITDINFHLNARFVNADLRYVVPRLAISFPIKLISLANADPRRCTRPTLETWVCSLAHTECNSHATVVLSTTRFYWMTNH